MTKTPVTRREALLVLGASAGCALTSGRVVAQDSSITRLPSAAACSLSPQLEEGPFYLDPKLVRGDIREDRTGVPLRLLFRVVEAGNCAPVTGARVDVWHCDALGLYSGVDGQGDDHSHSAAKATFLRGTQAADSAGDVTFDTIYPGWYRGRTTHIHVKVILDGKNGKNVATSQLFMPDALSEYLYLNANPYNRRGVTRDTVNAADHVVKNGGRQHATFCDVKEQADRYLATLIIGIDRTATAPSGTGGGPPPPGHGPGGGPIRPRGSLIPGM
jgi:protocatechuate 3,4-dioxygenase beta subunit